MKSLVLLILFAALALPLAACEQSHTESTQRNWFGGTTHKETTVTETPLGTSVEQSKTVTH